MKQFEVISRYRQGESYRHIARELGIDRKTVKAICVRYKEGIDALDASTSEQEVEEATEQLVLTRSYDSSKRRRRTYTPEVEARMKELYQQELKKNKRLGPHKQALTAIAVHELLVEEGHSIGYRTVAHYWRQLKQKTREAFIRQEYPLGYRVEFDFGEVKLDIAGKVRTYYFAVFASPASDFYWAYLYTNQKQDVFQDAPIQFFEMVGGVYQELVYDNMRHIVTRFIGRSQKELNESLIKLSLYYGFEINVTNCFSGHEKGTVEGRVKHTRRQCFSKSYQFSYIETARYHLTQQLMQLNQTSQIVAEKNHLLAYLPPFELADMAQCFIRTGACEIMTIEEAARELKLAYVREHSQSYLKEASQRGLNLEEVLKELLCEEATQRRERSHQRRINQAKFHQKKYLADFDETVFGEHPRQQLRELTSLEFIKRKENAILIGNLGTGKTHFSIGIGIEACLQGMSVQFVKAPNLMIQLKEAVTQSQFVRFKRRFESVDLVIIDELGYLSFDESRAELLFNLLSNRNDEGSIIITTNLTFDRWQECFKDATLTGALVDRLAYQANVIDMRGESCRKMVHF